MPIDLNSDESHRSRDGSTNTLIKTRA